MIKLLKGDWTAARIKVQYETRLLNNSSIGSNKEAYDMIISCWDKELINLQEQVMAFFLNNRNKLIGYRLISSGTSSQCNIDIKFLVSLALHTMSSFIILAHNHPSGELEASNQDKDVTLKVMKALALIDVTLLDHIIICGGGYCSFSEKGYL